MGRVDKGVHQAGFLVLRETSMPSCLIELGFITSPEEEAFLTSGEGVMKMGEAIFQGFLRYKNRYFNGIVVPYKAGTQEPASPSLPIVEQETAQPTVETRPTPPSIHPEKADDGVKKERKNDEHEWKTTAIDDARPLFKVQILVSSRKLRANDAHFKDLENVESFVEDNLNKYTYGASHDYNEIFKLRKQILDKFPEAFIIAFKNGEKMNVNAAIQEFKRNRQTIK